MFNRFLLLGVLLCLSSCAYVLDRQIQDITILTPGAEDTVCYVYVEGLRYKVHPPETVNISKSKDDLIVDCLAPQNRRRKVVIEPALSDHEFLNATNAGTGAVWDYAANAMFTYPDIVEVDFTSARTSPESLPAQNNPDIKQPEEYMLEEFRPGLPALNSDRGAVQTPILRRQHVVPSQPYTESAITPYEGPGKPADKGDLNSVIDGLTTTTTPPPAAPAPSGPPVPGNSGPPVPLTPAQPSAQ
jgi:hypothetical protein